LETTGGVFEKETYFKNVDVCIRVVVVEMELQAIPGFDVA